MYEQARHECAVRQLCKWRKEWGLNKFRLYITKYSFDEILLQDFYTQYELGNRGDKGIWILKKSLSQQQGLGI
jgi:hypothetical protein